MSDWVKIAKKSELPPGAKKLVDVGGRPVALFNVHGLFFAIDDICTHDGGPLAEGELRGNEIECPRHGARFNVETGEALSMPAFEPVATHAVKVEGDDVFVKLSD